MTDNSGKIRLKAKRHLAMKKKPKIAVCFHGHLRTYKECAPFLKLNFLRYYDCDLFIHTWSDIDHNTPSWHNRDPLEGKSSAEDLLNTYGEFKKIIIEEQIVEKLACTDEGLFRINLGAIKTIFLARAKLFAEVLIYAEKHNVKYDYVCYIRPDLWFKQPFLLEESISSCATELDNTIFTAFIEWLDGNDLVFYATIPAMKKFMAQTGPALEKCFNYIYPSFIVERVFDQMIVLARLYVEYISAFGTIFTIKRLTQYKMIE